MTLGDITQPTTRGKTISGFPACQLIYICSFYAFWLWWTDAVNNHVRVLVFPFLLGIDLGVGHWALSKIKGRNTGPELRTVFGLE